MIHIMKSIDWDWILKIFYPMILSNDSNETED